MLRASWVATEGGQVLQTEVPTWRMLVEGLKDSTVGHNGLTCCYISMIAVVSNFVYVRILNTLGFYHCIFVKIEEYIIGLCVSAL